MLCGNKTKLIIKCYQETQNTWNMKAMTVFFLVWPPSQKDTFTSFEKKKKQRQKKGHGGKNTTCSFHCWSQQQNTGVLKSFRAGWICLAPQAFGFFFINSMSASTISFTSSCRGDTGWSQVNTSKFIQEEGRKVDL